MAGHALLLNGAEMLRLPTTDSATQASYKLLSCMHVLFGCYCTSNTLREGFVAMCVCVCV